jgi:hypothetical protein
MRSANEGSALGICPLWMELAKATPRRLSDLDNPQVTFTDG